MHSKGIAIPLRGDKYMQTIKFCIELEDAVEKNLRDIARIKGMPVEQYVADLVNRYALSLHTMNQEELAKGYEDTGDINLDWANLK